MNLKIKLKNEVNPLMNNFIHKKIEKIEIILEEYSGEENREKVQQYVNNLSAEDGGFCQLRMWKLKSTLCPRKCDPPMAKIDKSGKLITTHKELKELYLSTYTERLGHREMEKKFDDIFLLKNKLWELRYSECLKFKTPHWSEGDIYKVLKKLKNNKTRDPLGMINELFKPGVIGQDLLEALLSLLNEVKLEHFVPYFMRLANISSLYKNRGCKKALSNDRGIFVLATTRMIMDRLMYNDLYPEIEKNMSNSNIGALKNKNVRNHLFIVHGIINSVLKGEGKCIDIQIYDIIQAFDALWLQDCMNDLYDALPHSEQNDKLAL